MIDRYCSTEFSELWSEKTKYMIWLEIELAVCEAMQHYNIIPHGVYAEIIKKEPNSLIDVGKIESLERITKHDVIAFLQSIEDGLGECGKWLHYGLTSSDVKDTALSIILDHASSKIKQKLSLLIESIYAKSKQYRNTPIIGRTHGIHAEPMIFGEILSNHYGEMQRAYERFSIAAIDIKIGKLSGAVGNYCHFPEKVEARALEKLNLRRYPFSSQIIARDYHAFYFMTISLIASAIERLAINIRHWQRTEVSEVFEPFSGTQKGSSAMPHKRNPILSENLCGLSRMIRSTIQPALENIPLWHERDMSHSSVERYIAPLATSTIAFMIDRMRHIVENMEVSEERMALNLQSTSLYESEYIMLKLIPHVSSRREAYEIIQKCVKKSRESGKDFISVLKEDSTVSSLLTQKDIDDAILSHA